MQAVMTSTNSRSDGRCPVNPEHGKLILLNGRLYCPHVSHAGRPASHPLGPLEPTPCFFQV
jgi:hypothetical protein